MQKINRIGQKIGMLTVMEALSETKYKRKSLVYLCKCDCGLYCKKSVAEFSSMKSCGCLAIQQKSSLIEKAKKQKGILKLDAGKSQFNLIWGQYKKSALKRKLEFSLTEESFRELIFKNCEYCNSAPKNKKRFRDSLELLYNGIDRIDNNKGYTVDNCVTCCKICNRAKNTLSKEEFVHWIKSLVVHLEL